MSCSGCMGDRIGLGSIDPSRLSSYDPSDDVTQWFVTLSDTALNGSWQ